MNKRLYDVGINNKGTTLRLWLCDDDYQNVVEYRADLLTTLEHLFSELCLNDWNNTNPKIKWGYPRFNKQETKDLLEGKV